MFVLIHSPLVGPYTWALVAEALQQRGYDAIVPTLTSPPEQSSPYWARHTYEVAQALSLNPPDQPLILVGHSGGGMLLPALRQGLSYPVAGYLFVDAGIPVDGKSRLDLFEDEGMAEQFRQAAVEGLLPTWTEADLRESIPKEAIRQRFTTEMQPMPLAVYEEPIPVPPDWPDAPCGYLRFGDNPAYDEPAERAQQAGWPFMMLAGRHFLMLVEPEQVTATMLTLLAQMSI
jgi:pimeloyl-ACP methyl ester carboxylesterase